MTSQIFRFASLFAAAVALIASDGAWAQLTITDGVTSKTACTGYGVTSGGGSTTITLTPNNCLTATSSGTDPVFSVRVAPAATTQSSTALQKVYVFVDADRDVPTTTSYSLTFNLCTSAQGCTSAGSGNWSFFRYSELGGAGFQPQDAVTTGSYTFTFQRGAHTSPTNLRSMGVGEMDVPVSPQFSATRNVMFGLSGTHAATNVVTHVITGGLQQVGVDLDINGNPIPNTPLSTTAQYQCELLGQSGSPGPDSGNPCGAYRIPVDTCSTNMTGANAITNAYLLQLEDYPGARIGNTLRMGFAGDSAMVFKFRTGAAGSFALPRPWGVQYSEQTNRGANRATFISVSEKKCDFNYDKLYVSGGTVTGKSGCYVSDLSGAIFGTVTATGASSGLSWTDCQLKPDTYYYLNMRWENANVPAQRGVNSCEPGNNPQNACGISVRFN